MLENDILTETGKNIKSRNLVEQAFYICELAEKDISVLQAAGGVSHRN